MEDLRKEDNDTQVFYAKNVIVGFDEGRAIRGYTLDDARFILSVDGGEGLKKYTVKEVPFETFRTGKFVVGTDGSERIQLYGILWAGANPLYDLNFLKHPHIRSVLKFLRHDVTLDKIVLGGGYLDVDHAEKMICVLGESHEYGYASHDLLEDAVKVPSYRVDVKRTSTYPHERDAERWFKQMGIPFEEYHALHS